MSKNIYIIGVGLIGGSFAIELKKLFPDSSLIGIDNSKQNLISAKRLKIIDTSGTVDNIINPFIILLAIPVKSIIETLPNVLNKVNPNTVVLDFGSTKNSICKSVIKHKNRSNFIAAHPIAGTEFSGPSAAHHGLFQNKNIIICDREKSYPQACIPYRPLFRRPKFNAGPINARPNNARPEKGENIKGLPCSTLFLLFTIKQNFTPALFTSNVSSCTSDLFDFCLVILSQLCRVVGVLDCLLFDFCRNCLDSFTCGVMDFTLFEGG